MRRDGVLTRTTERKNKKDGIRFFNQEIWVQKILTNIANSGDDDILLKNAISFAADSLFCEFAYVIDFDKSTFEVFRGFNKDVLGSEERFSGLDLSEDANEYKQVKFIKSFSLNNLPTKEEFFERI